MSRFHLLYFTLCICFSIIFSSGQIENPDTHLRLTQTRLILEKKKFDLDNNIGEEKHGNIAENKAGKRFMVYNPGQSLIFLPFYSFANTFSYDKGTAYYNAAFIVSFLNFILHFICAYLLYRIALKLGSTKILAFYTSLLFAFTSYSFVLAQSTYEHHFEMFFILLGFYYSTYKEEKNSNFKAGFAISIGLMFRISTILAIPSLLFLQKKTINKLEFILGLLIGFIFIFSFNYYRFGNIFETGYSIAWEMAGIPGNNTWNLLNLPIGLLGNIISPAKGLIFFSTTFLLSLFKIKKFYKDNRLFSISIFILLFTYLGVFSLNFAWHGSIWSFGPRYLLPIIPFLYLPIININNSKWLKFILGIAIICQFVLLTVNSKRNVLEEYQQNSSFNENEYIFNLKNEPHISQFHQLVLIFPKNFSNLYNYFPNEPWEKEVRTAPNNIILENSIEKNSINFWWIRILHSEMTNLIKVYSSLILILALIGVVFLSNYVQKNLIK